MSWPAVASGGVTNSSLIRSKRPLNVVFFGDSIPTYQQAMGYVFTGLTNITGVELRGTNQLFPSGAVTLSYDAAAKTLTLGDGAPVVITDGLFSVYLGNGIDYIRVGVTARTLSLTNKSDTLTPTTRYARWSNGSIAAIVDALTNRRFNFLPDMGIGGNRTSDMVLRFDQVLALKPDIIWGNGGTNSIVAAGATPASIVADLAVMWDKANAQGIPYIQMLISPRFGAVAAFGGTANDPGSASRATLGPLIIATNALILAAARTRSGVYVVDTQTDLVDSLTGRARDFNTADGLHNAEGAAFNEATRGTKILNQLAPDTQALQNVGLLSAYDATNNPGGNLLVSNRGGFVNAGGILQTGASLTPTWAATTAYAKDAFIISGDRLYRAAAAGTSGSSTPTHMLGTVVDGTVPWVFVQAGCSVLSWAATTAYAAGDIVVTSIGIKYRCSVAGTSGSTAPSAISATVPADGTVTWQFVDTGCSTGFAAGWIINRGNGAAMLANCHHVSPTDGGPDWQEFIFSGAVVNNKVALPESFLIYSGSTPFTLANMAAGDVIDTSIQVQLIDGENCAGIYMDYAVTGYPIVMDNVSLQNAPRGLPIKDPFTLSLKPLVWVGAGNATITAVNQRIYVQGTPNGPFRLRLRNMDAHKI